MIIVEQDKGYFINYDNATCITCAVDEKTKEFAIVANMRNKKDEIVLGIYKTEERVKEILESIISAYQAGEIFKYVDIKTQNQASELYRETNTTPFRFNMPKE